MKISFVCILTVFSIVYANDINGPLPDLVGRWVEDEPLRTGLNDFLWARGVNWFKRQYATSLTTWRYEQTIIWKNGGYQVSGIKGPLREVFSYKLTPDNRTVEMINIGEIGGQKSTTATVVGSSLISYLADPTSGVVDMIAERSLAPGNRNVMFFKTKDVPYDYEMVATMRRQQ